MIEALWSVQFISNLGIFGSGVVVFETERIFGGDAKFYYLGSFRVKADGSVDADVEVTHYSGDTLSIFGNRRNFSLEVSGMVRVPEMELVGQVIGEPHYQMRMVLKKIADLP